jgi:hypothetical protein
MKSFHVSRRSFLKRCSVIAATAGLPVWFVERGLAAQPAKSTTSPNDRPGIALIGCGGQGTRDAQNAAAWGDVVAVCDVDENQGTAASRS